MHRDGAHPGSARAGGVVLRSRLVVGVGAALLVTGAAVPAHAATPTAVRCSTRAAGDANGDGRSDVLVGVPGKHASAGQVDPFVGSATGIRSTGGVLRQGAGGVPGITHAGNRFGLEIATGDVNGDGCADAAIAAPGDRFEPHADDGATHTGSITVLLGRRGVGTSTRGAQLLTAHTLGIEHAAFGRGTDSEDTTIQSLHDPVLGDFDGDGYADLALIDTVADEDADESFPSIVVVPGSASGLDLAAVRQFAMPGTVDGHFTGYGIQLATGDLRGDGFDDLVIAEAGNSTPAQTPHATHGDPTHPVLHVVFGSAAGLGRGIAGRVIDQETPGVPGSDRADGASVAVSVTTGDFDGDGRADIAWGQPDLNRVSVVYGSRNGIASAGAQTFTYGRGGVQGARTTVGGEFGTSLAAGDFNGDGDDELAVGSGQNHVSVLPGTHAHGLTAKGDLLWSRSTPGIPGSSAEGDGFGTLVQTGFFGRGAGADLLVSDPSLHRQAGDLTELFGSRSRDVGLTTAHATHIDEATPGVPGSRVGGDHFGGARY